jgi:DNA-binding Xre family transcriptional regulator
MDASVRRGAVVRTTILGGSVAVRFAGGQSGQIAVDSLPFATGPVTSAELNVDGSLVTFHGPGGDFQATAHELGALAAGRGLDRPDFAVRVGGNLRNERQRRGMSLRALADRSGIAAPNLSNFETGQVSPRLETLGRIADALGTTVAALVTLEAVNTMHVDDQQGPAMAGASD